MGQRGQLYRGDERLCPVLVADTFLSRLRGLLGRNGIEGALLLRPAGSVHTIGMRFDIDVAFLDGDGVVLRLLTMRRNRIGMPVLRARSVVETEAGAFQRWDLRTGDRLHLV